MFQVYERVYSLLKGNPISIAVNGDAYLLQIPFMPVGFLTKVLVEQIQGASVTFTVDVFNSSLGLTPGEISGLVLPPSWKQYHILDQLSGTAGGQVKSYVTAGNPYRNQDGPDPVRSGVSAAGLGPGFTNAQRFIYVLLQPAVASLAAPPGANTATISPPVQNSPAVAAGGGTWAGTGTYYYAITAVTAAGESTISNEKSAIVTALTQTVNLSWTAVAGATSYKVYRATSSGAETSGSTLITTIGSGSTVTYADTGTAASASHAPTSNTAAIPAPTVTPTVAVTGGGTTGGHLPPGAYYLKYTFTNAAGETTVSAESTQFTVAAGNIPQVTLPALEAGATGISIYLTPANGASGSEIYYTSGVTVTAFNMVNAAGSSMWEVSVNAYEDTR
jgi:hypothetical protein